MTPNVLSMHKRPTILGMRVDPTSYREATRAILSWAHKGESRYVCVANVHMVMEAFDHPDFREQVNRADLVTPDGMPLVWMLRMRGYSHQERVYGPDLTLHVCEAAAREGIPVGFYGGRPETLQRLVHNLTQRYPGLRVVYTYSPPFRPLTEEEDQKIVQAIRDAGVRILFVGLGCPKQEWWMAHHHGRIPAVMVGVGAAFDFHAGQVRQAPRWMQRMGLEWAFRLSQEPLRLWRRYLIHNPRFLWYISLEQLGLLKKRKKEVTE